MADTYEEHCMTLARQQATETREAVVERRSTVGGLIFTIAATLASVERVFSLMMAAWTDQPDCCSPGLSSLICL